MTDKVLNFGAGGTASFGDSTTNASEAVHKLTAEVNALTFAVEKAQRTLDRLLGEPLKRGYLRVGGGGPGAASGGGGGNATAGLRPGETVTIEF